MSDDKYSRPVQFFSSSTEKNCDAGSASPPRHGVADGWLIRLWRWILREINRGHFVGNLLRLRLREIRQHDDGESIIHVARNLGLEALPLAFMLDHVMAVLVADEPAIAIMAGVSARGSAAASGSAMRQAMPRVANCKFFKLGSLCGRCCDRRACVRNLRYALSIQKMDVHTFFRRCRHAQCRRICR